MYTNNDIKNKSIFVINCIEKRNLRVSNGELLLEDTSTSKTLTKMPFQKILALFVIGHISITTPLIDKCKRFNVALIVVKPNLRPVFIQANSAEANFLLRRQQYLINPNDINAAKSIVKNKIANQQQLLVNTRKKDVQTITGIKVCEQAIKTIDKITQYEQLMGIEGYIARRFFELYYIEHNWDTRRPRTKCDIINATLDIGYTILFNFIECYVRMFGFDVYKGVYHRLWFRRKSLICDLVEPFRCIIDRAIRTALNKGQCKASDFKHEKGEYVLKREKNGDYQRLFFEALIKYKSEIFLYIQAYYRAFMQNKSYEHYPQFKI